MTALDWSKNDRRRRQRERKRAAKKKRTVAVHPNSMAARKWGRKEWRTTSS